MPRPVSGEAAAGSGGPWVLAPVGRGLGLTWRLQEAAAAEEIEVRPAKHLAFQHLEAVNVPRLGQNSTAGSPQL